MTYVVDNIGSTGQAYRLIMANKANKVADTFPQYEPKDKGWMFTQYDSKTATVWKRGAGVLPLNDTIPRPVIVIKDIPFKPKKPMCCCGDGESGSSGGGVGLSPRAAATVARLAGSENDVEIRNLGGDIIATVEGTVGGVSGPDGTA